MQTLGVSGPEQQEDNFFQRLFWPTVRNQYDVDLIGSRGFWLALVVGLLSSIALLVQGHWALAALTFLVFGLGAAGIRQRSTPAAAIIFSLYFIGIAFQWALILLGRLPFSTPFVSLVCIALLLSCVRATALSKQFSAEGDQDFPEARVGGFLNVISTSFPERAWPSMRIVFFVLSALLLLLNIAGAALALTGKAVDSPASRSHSSANSLPQS